MHPASTGAGSAVWVRCQSRSSTFSLMADPQQPNHRGRDQEREAADVSEPDDEEQIDQPAAPSRTIVPAATMTIP
jgi:hypothetical protein